MTDADVLYDFIMAPDMTTTIFYHDEIVHKQQIANLVRIIGQDNLISMVHGSHPKIILTKQKEPCLFRGK